MADATEHHDHDHDHHEHNHHDDGFEASSASIGEYAMRIVFGFVIVAVMLSFSAAFQTSEGYNSVVTRFDRPVQDVEEPGLYWKLPWPIDKAHQVDMRKRIFSTSEIGTTTADKANVILQAYVVWRVDDARTFLQSVGTSEQAEKNLTSTVEGEMNELIGDFPRAAFVSTDANQLRTEEFEKQILAKAREAATKYGVFIEQVGIKRVAVSNVVMAAVLKNIKADRTAKAQEYRSQGRRDAQLIEDNARSKAAETIALGQVEAGQIRGEGDREAAAILASAEKLDPEFYQFWRSLKMVEVALSNQATVILRTDSGPFRNLFSPPPGPSNPPAVSEEKRLEFDDDGRPREIEEAP